MHSPAEDKPISNSQRMEKVFNDCVHGHIRLHPLCVKIIDTPEFQRLRNIKQLGFTYYVYPGASHNRFEHSLGVCYLAGRMVEALRSNSQSKYFDLQTEISKEEQLCVEIAGLCHDIGHGPFSHTWEQILLGRNIIWQHETASVNMFDYLIEQNGLEPDFQHYKILDRERRLIKELIKGEGEMLPPNKKFLYQIVANKENDIDVDKWDYFLRDGMQLNIKITFDYHRLLEFCCVINVGGAGDADKGKRVIGYRNKEFHNLWDMFRVRADLHRRAYQHKVVKNIDLMLKDAFIMADEVFRLPVGDTEVQLSEAHKDMKALSSLTDHIFYMIYYNNDPALKPARDILKRILTRKLYTFIGSYDLKKEKTKRLSDTKKIIDELVKRCSKPEHELKSCVIKLDFGQHDDPLSKVVLFNKSSRTPSTTSMAHIAKGFPVQLSSPILELYVYCTKYNLEPEKCEEIKNNVERELGSLNLLNTSLAGVQTPA